MAGEWDTWLRELARSEKGGVKIPAIDRGLPYEFRFSVDVDASGDDFAAVIRASPDAAGDPLAEFAVDIGAYADGETPVSLTLTAAETAALPEDGDASGVAGDFVFDVLWTHGAAQDRILAGVIPVTGKVTDYGS